jgi:S1-C subfamily serine protease
MKPSRLFIGLSLSLLSGCAAAERIVLALAPDQEQGRTVLALASDQERGRTTQRPLDARPKTKTGKQPQPQPPTLPAGASEVAFPAWSVPSPKPSRILTSTLTPSQLFKKVSPAVYAVMVGQVTPQVTSQGSAVAVSSKEAITNCHVVAGAKSITLANAAAKHSAEVISADPAKDRCYLRVLDGELEPVPGFRDYATLTVGEAVFTIGSPKGLVNTLSDGLLSGLRKSEDDAEYIQISAPVSEGSSGGGVFDDRGNLIGVITFTIRDSQNLNFAIAASQFWR